MANAKVQVRRTYEDPAQGDGTRVLVDRVTERLRLTADRSRNKKGH